MDGPTADHLAAQMVVDWVVRMVVYWVVQMAVHSAVRRVALMALLLAAK